MKRIIQAAMLIALLILPMTSSSVVYWTIVDPGKTGAYLNQVIQAITEHAYQVAMHKISNELNINLTQKDISTNNESNARDVASSTQVATDIHNRLIEMTTSVTKYACDYEAASVTHSQTSKKFKEHLSTRSDHGLKSPEYQAKSLFNTLLTDSTLGMTSARDIMIGNSVDEHEAEIFGEVVAPSPVAGAYISGISNKETRKAHTSKLSMISNMIQTDTEAIALENMEFDNRSYSSSLESSFTDVFAGQSEDKLGYLLNSDPNQKSTTPATKKDVASMKAIKKAHQIKADFEQYKKGARKQLHIMTQNRLLMDLLKNL